MAITCDKQRVLSSILLVDYFLAWVACCVAFGGPLHFQTGAGNTIMFYYDHFTGLGFSTTYANAAGVSFASICQSSGSGLVFVAVVCFLACLVAIVFRVLHFFDLNHRMPFVGHDAIKYSLVEKILVCSITALLLIMSILWGATCYQSTQSSIAGYSQYPSGYAYIVICFFFMIGGTIALFYMWKSMLVVTHKTEQTKPNTNANTNAKTNANADKP